MSATVSEACARPSQPTQTVVPSAAGPGELARHLVEQVGAADGDLGVLDPGPRPGAGQRDEVGGPRHVDGAARGRGDDGPRDRVLAAGLDGGGGPQRLVLGQPAGGGHVDEGHLAGGDGAGLVEHDGVDAPGVLEHVGALDQDAEARPAPGAHQQRGRGREAQRAGAGDDEHGDGDLERARRLAGGDPPPGEGQRGEHEHDGHEHGRHPVGEPLHRRLAGLGALDEPGDAGERGVGADPGGLDDEPPGAVDRAAGDLVAGGDVDGQRLAGDERGVDRAAAVDDPAVGGDLLAGPHDEPVADDEVVDGDAHLGGGPGGGVDPLDGDVLGAQAEQAAQRVAGAVGGAGLQPAAEEQEGRDDGGGLEPDVRGGDVTGIHARSCRQRDR